MRSCLLILLASLTLGACGGAPDGEAATGVDAPPEAGTGGEAAPDDPALEQIDAFVAERDLHRDESWWRTRLPRPPMLSFDYESDYLWELQTSEGPITVRLMPDIAPMHVSSTIYLTRVGFYDGLTFHRIIPGFMAQGGCPLGSGSGDPGYQYDGEFSPSVSHDRPGLLSMANAGPGTDGSQFFLTFVPTPHLDGKHTIFGEVVEGMDTLEAIEAVGTPSGPPTETVTIEEASIRVTSAAG